MHLKVYILRRITVVTHAGMNAISVSPLVAFTTYECGTCPVASRD